MSDMPTDYQRGVTDGIIAEKIDGLEQHAEKVNGSIAGTGEALKALESTVRTQGEDARLRDERVIAAADALAAETEKRRTALEEVADAGNRKWTGRERWMGLAIGVTVVGGFVLGLVRP